MSDWLIVFNATFSNIMVTSFSVEEAGENHQPTGKLYHLRVECTLFCNLQRWSRTHPVLVIGLYQLLDPTT